MAVCGQFPELEKSMKRVIAGGGVGLVLALMVVGRAVAFGFDMGDSFNEGIDFDDGNSVDLGGSRMNWESPDNVWDTGTRSHKGFSWGGGPRSGPSWGMRDAPPHWWGGLWRGGPQPPMGVAPPDGAMPYGMIPPGAPAGWGAPPQPPVHRRPPAPPAPSSSDDSAGARQ